MSENPGRTLLHALLDSYERRKDPEGRAISVSIDCIRGYADHIDGTTRMKANRFLCEAQLRGWIELRWEKGEEGNILKRASLNVNAAPEVYAFLKRTPNVDRKQAMEALLLQYLPEVGEVFRPVIEKLQAQLSADRSIAPLSLSDLERSEDLLRVMVGLNTLTGELPERNFSARVLGNSKRLADLSAPITTLIERAYPDLAGLAREEVWAAVGLLPNPGHVYVSGPMVIRLRGREIDVGAFVPDIGIPVHAIQEIEIRSTGAEYLLTIENRTTFYDYLAHQPHAGLVLYLGGFPNMARRQILSQIHKFAPDLPFYHWGDLDYGGLAIVSHLRHNSEHTVLPHHMDITTLETYASSWLPLSQNDQRNLARLLNDPWLADMRDTIEYMMARAAKLEQEVEQVALVSHGNRRIVFR